MVGAERGGVGTGGAGVSRGDSSEFAMPEPVRDVRLRGMSNPSSPAGAGGAMPVSGGSRMLTRDEFGRQFEGSRRKLWWVAVSVLGRREQADDVLQDAAMIALGKLDEFDPATSFEAWMAQVVRFVALNAARKRARRAALAASGSEEPVAPERIDGLRIRSDGSVPRDQQAFDDRVVRALDGLPEIARACLLLRAVEGLSYREISVLLSIPEGTAMSHVHRARTAMRRSLSGDGAKGGAE